MINLGKLAALLALLSVSCNAQDTSAVPPISAAPQKSEKELRGILQNACIEVNQFYKAEGFPILVSSADHSDFKYQTVSQLDVDLAGYYNRQHVKFDKTFGIFRGSEPSRINANILADSGNFSLFDNSTAELASETHRLDPSTANWTEAQILEVATKFADIFTKPWGRYLGKPEVRKLQEGDWWVAWPEQSSSGIPFFGARGAVGVQVSLSPKYGPYKIEISLSHSQCDDKPIKRITPEKALSRAREELTKAVSAGLEKDWFDGGKIFPKESKVNLRIVECIIAGQIEERLAWVVIYPYTTPDPYTRGDFGIIIDAEDGSLLAYINPNELA